MDDINSELQDQGIGVAGDAFSTQVQIMSHCLRNGKLDLKAKLGVSLKPLKVDWESLRQDVPATLASYILKHGIGQKSANSDNQIPYEWAKGFMPSLWRAMVQLTETYGVVMPKLGSLRCVLRRAATQKVGPKCQKKNNLLNRHSNAAMKYGVLIPDTPEKAKEIDPANGNNLWNDAIFEEAQTQIDCDTYPFLEPEEEIPEGY